MSAVNEGPEDKSIGEASYCLDVVVGYYETDRTTLVRVLEKEMERLAILAINNGHNGDKKAVRILTERAAEVMKFIASLPNSGQNECEIHYSAASARQSKKFRLDEKVSPVTDAKALA